VRLLFSSATRDARGLPGWAGSPASPDKTSLKNYPYRDGNKSGNADNQKGEKELAHQTNVDASGNWAISLSR
jgi:hypothetical protein